MNSQVTTDANAVVQPQQTAQYDMVELVASAQAGSPDAYAAIYSKYHDTVLRFCYYRLGNLHTAEDICAETFTRALSRLNTFHWRGKDLGAWIITIARNLVMDHYKLGHTRRETSVDIMVDANGTTVLDSSLVDADVADPVLQEERAKLVRDAIEMLNDQQRECIKLRFYDELTCEETALKMGKNEGAVKTLQYRATRSLARLLAPYESYL